jgi:fermentation-respiration switch protein FrsA (DUF1100 family)
MLISLSAKKISYGVFLTVWILTSLLLGYRLKKCKDLSVKEVVETMFQVEKPKPLEKYSIENLSKARVAAGRIKIIDEIDSEDDYTSYLFELLFDPTILYTGILKTTTGQINIPKGSSVSIKKYPIILMLRGYVDQELYETGDGTKNAAGFFASNGFITIAPDFLGYAGSDKEADNIFESRFQTYTTALSLLKTIELLDNSLEISSDMTDPPKLLNHQITKSPIFIWGHSNGGQIAITLLEITKADYSTTLWAPVTKPFPYSILYYTDESEDRGKLIRSELAIFEADYDVEKYSFFNYLEFINAPLQVHQGTVDNAVPVGWNDDFTDIFLDLNLDLDYYTYPGADHNMRPVWDTVVERDLDFFNSFLD